MSEHSLFPTKLRGAADENDYWSEVAGGVPVVDLFNETEHTTWAQGYVPCDVCRSSCNQVASLTLHALPIARPNFVPTDGPAYGYNGSCSVQG